MTTNENAALGQQFKALLIGGAGLLLAIFAGWDIGSANYEPIIFGALIVIGLSIWLFTGRLFWVITIASSFLGGTFPILGAAFTPFQILMAIGIMKFAVEDIILRRTSMKKPSNFDLLMIAGFMGVLTFHAVHHRMGLRFLGSSIWGGHNYVNVYVGLAAFFVVQSIPMKPKLWAKLPYAVLAVTTFDLLIAAITTVFPASIYKIYPFYSAVSGASLQEIITGVSDVTGRIGAFGAFGFTLIALILASVSLREILKPTNLLRLVGVIVGFIAVLFSGYRSAVINMGIGLLAAGIRDLKYGVLALLPLLAAILFALSVVNLQFFHLPKQVQRGVAFFPGKWDAEMVQDAAASNDFRRQIWSLWTKDYFPAQPWLGRGFGFRSEWSKTSTSRREAVDYRQMVETGNIHNGLFAALDTFGIVGTIFFVVWNLRILARTFRASFRVTEAGGIALRFLALYLAVLITSYWIGAQTVGSFLPLEFALAGVFLRLQDALVSDSVRSPLAASKLQHNVREELAST